MLLIHTHLYSVSRQDGQQLRHFRLEINHQIQISALHMRDPFEPSTRFALPLSSMSKGNGTPKNVERVQTVLKYDASLTTSVDALECSEHPTTGPLRAVRLLSLESFKDNRAILSSFGDRTQGPSSYSRGKAWDG